MCAGPAVPTSGFPIPMRGNELVRGGAMVAAELKFPIPMRGNERNMTVDHVVPRSKFPIPMRGNEGRTAALPTAPPPTGVSDPHEG